MLNKNIIEYMHRAIIRSKTMVQNCAEKKRIKMIDGRNSTELLWYRLARLQAFATRQPSTFANFAHAASHCQII